MLIALLVATKVIGGEAGKTLPGEKHKDFSMLKGYLARPEKPIEEYREPESKPVVKAIEAPYKPSFADSAALRLMLKRIEQSRPIITPQIVIVGVPADEIDPAIVQLIAELL